MTNEYFKKSYKQIFDQIYPHIKNQQLGTLSTVFYLILNESEARELCEEYGVKKNYSLDEDLDLADDIIYTVSIDKQKLVKANFISRTGGEIVKNISRPFRKSLDSNEDKMEFIVVAAVILIGAFFSQKLLIKDKSKNILSSSTKEISSPSLTRQPTAICLAVPASAVFGLTIGKAIDRNEIIQLIEAASDFICTQVGQAETLGVDIDINQSPSPDSQLKFYIRIDIPDGREIIGGETKYVIKRDLRPNTQGEIKELGRLRSISSISSFNRI